MKLIYKIWISLIIIALHAIHSYAEQQVNTDNKGLLWKISSSENNTPQYIFGTIHLICENDYFWTHTLDSIFNYSDQLILETNILEMKNIMAILANQEVSDNTLNDKKENIDYLMSLQNNISQSKVICEDENKSYEVELAFKAVNNDKSIIGLETIEEQLNLAVNYINHTNKNNRVNDSLSLIDYYLDQDIEKLASLLLTDDKDKAAADLLIYERNYRWVEKLINNLFKDRSNFVAVGAGHLGGTYGVLNLLKNKGYTIEPIKININ